MFSPIAEMPECRQWTTPWCWRWYSQTSSPPSPCLHPVPAPTSSHPLASLCCTWPWPWMRGVTTWPWCSCCSSMGPTLSARTFRAGPPWTWPGRRSSSYWWGLGLRGVVHSLIIFQRRVTIKTDIQNTEGFWLMPPYCSKVIKYSPWSRQTN